MDCPVCFEAITATTGQVTTSCGHTFHFKCLNSWYYHQFQQENAQESCPCCRQQPGEFERASTVEGTEADAESETATEDSESDWVQVGPNRWIVPSSRGDGYQVVVEYPERKEDGMVIPPYDAESHALWILRNFFDVPLEPAQPREPLHSLDTTRMMRRRRRSFGRNFWSHLGTDYKLESIDGYNTD